MWCEPKTLYFNVLISRYNNLIRDKIGDNKLHILNNYIYIYIVLQVLISWLNCMFMFILGFKVVHCVLKVLN